MFELVVAGRQLDSGDIAIMMVEAGGTEKSFSYYAEGARKVDEEVLADGLEACKVWIKESIALQRQLVASVIATRGPIVPLTYTPQVDYGTDVFDAVEKLGTTKLAKAITISAKADRNAATDEVTTEVLAELCGTSDAPGEFAGREKEVKEAVRSLTKKLVRRRIVDEGARIDGRGPTDLRPVSAEVGVLPTAHGSGLFQRGETQVMTVATLAMPRMNQLLDTLSPETTKRYMHHYNMPPWANGETGRVGSPKRREIGHGALAARAVLPTVPSQEEFAYTLRLVSEVLASNGSTSMASVCASSLALMDAGVQVTAPVAGIAMGLVFDGGKYTTLTDILGAEDAYGDMDFKVAGTADAVTALQLDTKIDGIPADVLSAALQQAKDARLKILEVMNATLAAPRAEVAATAPKIVSITIPIDKVGEVIGPKGKVINTIQTETGADISVDDDGAVGIVTIGAVEAWRMEAAKAAILAIVDPPKAELGKIYTGRVVNITKFGAFVNILPGRDGLVHISKLGRGKRINAVEDVLSLGDEIEVRVEEIDDRGKVSLVPAGDLADGDGGSDVCGIRWWCRPRACGAHARIHGPASASAAPRSNGDDIVTVNFEDSFDAELRTEHGDLGPASVRREPDRDDSAGDREVGAAGVVATADPTLQHVRPSRTSLSDVRGDGHRRRHRPLAEWRPRPGFLDEPVRDMRHGVRRSGAVRGSARRRLSGRLLRASAAPTPSGSRSGSCRGGYACADRWPAAACSTSGAATASSSGARTRPARVGSPASSRRRTAASSRPAHRSPASPTSAIWIPTIATTW